MEEPKNNIKTLNVAERVQSNASLMYMNPLLFSLSTFAKPFDQAMKVSRNVMQCLDIKRCNSGTVRQLETVRPLLYGRGQNNLSVDR
jgi:hypothetical protein